MTKVSVRRRNESERQDGRAVLYAVVTFAGNQVRIPTGVAAAADEWDPVGERIRGRSKEASDRNLILDHVRKRIHEILVRVRLNDEVLTKELLLRRYKDATDPTLFIPYARKRLDFLRPSLQPETIRHHISVLRKLEDYSPGLRIADITVEWLRVYAAHLRNFHGNNPGTIGKNLSIIRSHFNGALREGKVRENPFEAFRMPQSRPAVVYLTEEELARMVHLYRYGGLDDLEQDVLRFWLFMAFTGMHISDARNLQIAQIRGGVIHYERIKTGTSVSVPLSKPAASLVEHYRGGRHRGNLMQTLPTDQCFNRLIKRIAARAEIDKPICAKTARHTFATIYYRRNRGDLGTLSKLLGHMSIKTTMIYAHIMEESKSEGIAVFDDML